MPAASLPTNERERLAELARYDAIEAAVDPRLTAFAGLAADVMQAPIGLVTLIDDTRQWVHAAHGMQTGSMPRDIAFCAHAILRPNELLVVPDAQADPRFRDNPMVRGSPGIRFYAGVPLLGPSDLPLGALCVMDRSPRQIDEGAQDRLRALASGVMGLLDLGRARLDLARAELVDPATGLASRMEFLRRLDAAVAGGLHGLPCGLVTIRLEDGQDRLERDGQPGLDRAVRATAQMLTSITRSGDLLARLDRDCLGLLLTAPVEPVGVAALVARLRAALARMPSRDDDGPGAYAVGAASCPHDAIDVAGLLRVAESRRRPAPLQGTPMEHQRPAARSRANASEEARLEEDLREAIRGGTLDLHWQPYFSIPHSRPLGHEALLRWNRPGYGPVSPALVIPFAEARGLIGRIDTWVIGAACRQAAARDDMGLVAVNVSGDWFGDSGADLPRLIARTLKETGLPASRLMLEMTERTLVANAGTAAATIDRLRGMGVGVALDDFGTGYSSLAYLHRFAFDRLKLDRAFVGSLAQDERAEAVARAVLRLGRDLGMTICAEGVETEAQLAFLAREGCDLVQGFLLGRPAPRPVLAMAERAVAAP